jgi:IPT/TIG domain
MQHPPSTPFGGAVVPRLVLAVLLLALVALLGPAKQAFAAAEPTVTGIEPKSGPTSGETPVTITGTGFVEGVEAKVKIGAAEATEVHVESTTQITATTTPEAAGEDEVTVEQEGVTSTGEAKYTYVPSPAVTTVEPNSGPTSGGTAVTIKGTGFVASAKVKVGTAEAQEVRVVSATEITATTPAAGAGAYGVTVEEEGVTSTGEARYTYVAPAPAPTPTPTPTPTITPTPPATTAITPTSKPPPVRVPVPLVSHLHTRLVHKTTLEVRFRLAVKARARLVGRKGKKVVAHTRLKMLAPGMHKLLLKLNRHKWPTKIELQAHALAALPTVVQGG